MDDTIKNRLHYLPRGQIFRITYKSQDFQIKLLQKGITKDVNEIDILLDGFVKKLIKIQDKWEFEGSDKNLDFAHNIWRAISLRYRL
ncbi:hypothetical protein GCM10009120_04920 [Sphingobacterium siyangense subsp. cladoniae]|uniref:hypothetical protein n=1 Tax=Sphingobacterium siyangense TaxID=459529 RepID=UPI0031F967B3